jgi:hypothetical protein
LDAYGDAADDLAGHQPPRPVARVGALDRLVALVAKDQPSVTSAVYADVVTGVNEGRQFLHSMVELVKGGRLILFTLTANVYNTHQ